MATPNPAFLFNKRLHWVLCSVESRLLNWSNYGKKIKWKNFWPSRNWAKAPPSGVWGSDDLRIIPISDLSTTFLACKGKGGPQEGIQGTATSWQSKKKTTVIFSSALVALTVTETRKCNGWEMSIVLDRWRRQQQKQTKKTLEVNRHSSV